MWRRCGGAGRGDSGGDAAVGRGRPGGTQAAAPLERAGEVVGRGARVSDRGDAGAVAGDAVPARGDARSGRGLSCGRDIDETDGMG